VSQLEDFLMNKTAETSGTQLMPNSAPTYSDRDRSPTKTIRKVGGIATFDDLKRESSTETAGALERGEGVSGEQVQQLPQAAPFKLRVDTTGKEAPARVETKEAQHYALPGWRRYPLDSYGEVKQASAYFGEWKGHMAPEMRREYCQNLVKRASALGIPVSEDVRKYGAGDYAPAGELMAALDMRWGILREDLHKTAFVQLKECQPMMHAEDFAVALGEFDKVAGIEEFYDRDIYDPYYSTFGEKRAEDDNALLVGNDYISANDMRTFAATAADKLKDTFGLEFVNEFRKDPLTITRSLPKDQQKVVIRTAASALTDPTTT
jgi:hypothetical protein